MIQLTHIFGPMSGVGIAMAAPRVPGRIFYAPVRDAGPFGAGYIMVEFDRVPEVPWPGQVEYVLDRERSRLEPHELYGAEGMEQGTAVYMLAAS